MTELTPDAWTTTQDFRDVVKPSFHADFLQTIAAAHAEGYAITKVVVVGGVPVIYQREEAPRDV